MEREEVKSKNGLPSPFKWTIIVREYEGEFASPGPAVRAKGSLGAARPHRQAARVQGSLPCLQRCGGASSRKGRRAPISSIWGEEVGHRSWIYRCVNCAIVASKTRPFEQKKIASVPISENSVQEKFAEFLTGEVRRIHPLGNSGDTLARLMRQSLCSWL